MVDKDFLSGSKNNIYFHILLFCIQCTCVFFLLIWKYKLNLKNIILKPSRHEFQKLYFLRKRLASRNNISIWAKLHIAFYNLVKKKNKIFSDVYNEKVIKFQFWHACIKLLIDSNLYSFQKTVYFNVLMRYLGLHSSKEIYYMMNDCCNREQLMS